MVMENNNNNAKIIDTERVYFVYKHTNLINGKVYIGRTFNTYRWGKNGSGYQLQGQIWEDICATNWNKDWRHEILFDNLTLAEADALEIKMIAEYDATNPEKGYNKSTGGSAAAAGIDRNGEKNPMYGKKHTSDQLAKMHDANVGTNHPNYGKHGGHNHKDGIEQYDVKTGEYIATFATIAEAEAKTGIPRRKIQDVCAGRRKSSFGYAFKYVLPKEGAC